MNKTYADQCLERVQKATQGPWTNDYYSHRDELHVVGPASLIEGCVGYATFRDPEDAEFIAHSRVDVEELAKRLKNACMLFRALSMNTAADDNIRIAFKDIANVLEEIPEGDK